MNFSYVRLHAGVAMLHRRRAMAALAVISLCMIVPWTAANAAGEGRVIQQIVLIRHGIRSPTKPPRALAVYATEAWPDWPEAPGQLTPHGAQLMRALGTWHRRDMAAAGIPLHGCDTKIKVIADSTQRNRDSAAAMLDALMPGCRAPFYAFTPDHTDPLFQGSGGADDDDSPATSPPALPMPALAELQQVLLGCADDACLARARADGKKLLLGEKPAAALKSAGTLSENLMLEYVQGFPSAQVGWGRLDAAGVGRVIRLHNAQFAFSKKEPGAASTRGGTMLAHIAATFSTAAGQTSTLPALIPADAKVLVLIGHDTDLASQAGLLGLNWDSAVQPDDYPPGGALIYQLVANHGHYAVRLRIALPSLAALRAADVSDVNAMHVVSLHIKDCGGSVDCPLATFQHLVAGAVDPSRVAHDTGNEPTVP